METQEFEAGPDRLIVLYLPADVSSEIAADATARATNGLRMLSMATMPLRHGGASAGSAGSGCETKTSVAVLYERRTGVED